MPIKSLRSIVKQKKYQQKLKPLIRERQAYNKMQRGERMKPAEVRAANDFITKGTPKHKWR